MAEIKIGDTAPDFTLADQDGTQVHLADLRGKSKVVLIFYPGDDTPGCTRQLCAARDDAPLYQQAGAKVFGVNQAGAASHEKFVSKYQLTTPLLVDSGLQVAGEYDALNASGQHINRTVVGIDEQGKVTYYVHGLPSTEEIIAAIR